MVTREKRRDLLQCFLLKLGELATEVKAKNDEDIHIQIYNLETYLELIAGDNLILLYKDKKLQEVWNYENNLPDVISEKVKQLLKRC